MKNKIAIAVCEDERIILEIIDSKLKSVLAQIKFQEYEIGLFQSGLDLINSKTQYNLILLDIELPDVDGLSLAKKLNDSEIKPIIILITNHKELMEWGFHVRAFRYLTKPINNHLFNEAIINAINEILLVNTVIITEGGKSILLDLKEIIYIESLGEGCCIYTNESKYIRREPLKYWLNRFPKNEFVQTHRSYIVNLRHVDSIEASLVCMKNGNKAPISVRKRKTLNDAMHLYIRRKFC